LDSISAQLDAKIAEISALGGQVEELEALKAALQKDKKALMSSKSFDAKEYQNKIKSYEAMLLEKDAEIAKLKEENAFKILEMFDEKDLRGISAVRNFIAHDYDSVDDSIIEDVLRHNFPKLKNDVEKILKTMDK